MDWQKIIKFLMPILLIIIATTAFFLGLAGFTEWSIACGGFVGLWLGNKGLQALKGRMSKK